MKRIFLISTTAAIFLSCANQSRNTEPSTKEIMNKEVTVANYATDPAIETGTKSFLKALNNSGGTPMEQLQPSDARKVLEGAQTSVSVDVSGIEETEKTITEDGSENKSNSKQSNESGIKNESSLFPNN